MDILAHPPNGRASRLTRVDRAHQPEASGHHAPGPMPAGATGPGVEAEALNVGLTHIIKGEPVTEAGSSNPRPIADLAEDYRRTWREAQEAFRLEHLHQAEVDRLAELADSGARAGNRKRLELTRAVLERCGTPIPDEDRWHHDPSPLAVLREGGTTYLVSPGNMGSHVEDDPTTFEELAERTVLTILEDEAAAPTETTPSPEQPDAATAMARQLLSEAADRFEQAEATLARIMARTWAADPGSPETDRWKQLERQAVDAVHLAEQALAYRIDDAVTALGTGIETHDAGGDFVPFGIAIEGAVYTLKADVGDMKPGIIESIRLDRIIGFTTHRVG